MISVERNALNATRREVERDEMSHETKLKESQGNSPVSLVSPVSLQIADESLVLA